MFDTASYGADFASSDFIEGGSSSYMAVGGGRSRRKKRKLSRKQKQLSKLKQRSQYVSRRNMRKYQKKRRNSSTSSVITSLESGKQLSRQQVRQLSPKLRQFLSRVPESSRSIIRLGRRSRARSKRKNVRRTKGRSR